MTIITARWPPTPVPYARGQNEEAGLAELLMQTAANTASIVGHTVGGQRLVDADNPAPINPSGDFGHDHSGGEFGRPLFRSVASISFAPVVSSTYLAGPARSVRLHVTDMAGSATNQSNAPQVLVWVPPCDAKVGAYVWLGVAAALNLEATALVSGDAIEFVVRSRHPRLAALEGAERRLTVSSPTSTGSKVVTSSTSADRLRVVPGAMNPIELLARVVRTSGGSNRGCRLRVDELELGVHST